MKQIRLIIAALFIAGIIAVASAGAQPANRPTTATAQQPTTTATAPATTQTALGPVAIAVVSTAQFEDPQRGIQRLIAAYQTLQREFQPRVNDIQQRQQRLEALAAQIQSTTPVARPEETEQRRAQAATLQTEITRLTEDVRAEQQRRLAAVIVPINRDIATALEAFARGRGVTAVFDISRLGEVMFVTSPAIDITNDFVADYNRRNPATVAPVTAPTTAPTTTPARPTTTPARRP